MRNIHLSINQIFYPNVISFIVIMTCLKKDFEFLLGCWIEILAKYNINKTLCPTAVCSVYPQIMFSMFSSFVVLFAVTVCITAELSAEGEPVRLKTQGKFIICYQV